MIKRTALAALCVTGISLAFLAAPGPLSAADQGRAIDAIFAPFGAAQSPGCAVGVAHGAEPPLTRAYGSADLEHDVAITPDTIFEAGSISKQFTAAAILMLANQRKLSLDDDVRKYLPELPSYGRRVTIRHFLNHTSGLKDWGAIVEAAGRPRGTRVYSNADVLDIVSRQRSVNFASGAEYLYNNTGYSLLPIVVQRVSGETLAEFTRRRIFEPLGMRHTSWRDDFTRVVKDRAVAYTKKADGFVSQMPFENAYGHAGLLTTVGDLLLWNANFTSARVGDRELVNGLQQRARLANGQQLSYAGGLVVSRYREVDEISHTGSTAGYRAFLARYPRRQGGDVSIAVLCNLAQANAADLAHQVADVVLSLTRAPSGVAAATPGDKPQSAPRPRNIADYVGAYQSDELEAEYATAVVNGDLVLKQQPGFEARLVAAKRDAFTTDRGWTVRFDRDRSGRVVAMRLDLARARDLRFERID